jgi:hypothetical protein
MSTVTCAGNVTTSALGAAQCVDGSGAPLAWGVVPAFDFTQLDGPTMGGAFAAAFVLVGTGWAIGKGFGVVLSLMK